MKTDTLTGKKVLIGITGGIAAYKACDLIRIFIKAGADVKAILTPNALNFVTETTIRTLTKNQVYIKQFDEFEPKPEHISLADDADLLVIAPASANTIGKIAGGICDNLLTSVTAAFNKPVIVAPAMNCNMWANPFVQENVKKLRDAGLHVLNPEEGELACGYSGAGRLTDIDVIFNKACELLENGGFLKGKRIIVTAGGTKEPIDPVRYIGNHSSGKMGIAIADTAHRFGADVTLVATFDVEKPYEVVKTSTACEMLDTLKDKFPAADVLVMAAAVADYRAKEIASGKIKKQESDEMTVELVKNPDILKEIAKIRQDSQVVVGFCAETEELEQNARRKLEEKNLDFIVANDVSGEDSVFGSDYNEVAIFSRENAEPCRMSRLLKTEIAELLLKKFFA